MVGRAGQQHELPRLDRNVRCPHGGRRGSRLQALARMARGVELQQRLVLRRHPDVTDRLKDERLRRQRLWQPVVVDAAARGLQRGEQLCPGREHERLADVTGWLDADPRAGAAALVDGVVQQCRVPGDRDPPPCRRQVRLGGDCVLVVAEGVAEVGHLLHEGDRLVNRQRWSPHSDALRHRGEDQRPQALEVTRGVVDIRLDRAQRRTGDGEAGLLQQAAAEQDVRAPAGTAGGAQAVPQRPGPVLAARRRHADDDAPPPRHGGRGRCHALHPCLRGIAVGL